MRCKHGVVGIFVALFALAAAGCCDQAGADPQVADLKARIAALEAANKALEKQAVAAKPDAAPADCAGQLAACNERAARCEKDPFTGVKYLADQPGEKPAQQDPRDRRDRRDGRRMSDPGKRAAAVLEVLVVVLVLFPLSLSLSCTDQKGVPYVEAPDAGADSDSDAGGSMVVTESAAYWRIEGSTLLD